MTTVDPARKKVRKSSQLFRWLNHRRRSSNDQGKLAGTVSAALPFSA